MQTLTSNKIENELNQTSARLDELSLTRSGIQENLKILQDDFVLGKTDFDKTQSEQARLDTLNSLISSLEIKQRELQTAYDEAVENESLQTLLESARSAAVEAGVLFDDAIEMLREFAQTVGEFAEKLCDKFYAFRLKKKEYARLRRQLPPDLKLNLSPELADLVDRNYENLPPIKYADVILSAVDLVGEERYKMELREKRAG